MNEKMSLVKWVTGESRFFPEDIYQVNLDVDKNQLVIIHRPTNSVSLECKADQVLYVRYHLNKRQKDEDNEIND